MMKCYKGFDKDFSCRGFQYEENTEYETEKAEVCRSGFHYCHNPLDVLDFYPLLDDKCNFNQFAEVEPLGEELTDDNKKYCTKKIKIGAKLDLKGLIKASIDFIFENCKEQKNEKIQASSGYYAQLASSGNSAQLASSGDSAQLASSGNSAQLASSGDYAKLASSSNSAQLASSGNSAQLASSGDYAQLASSGDSAQLASSGYSAQLASSGDYAKINSEGEKAVVANIGVNGITKAKKGSFITLAEYEYADGHYEPIAVKSHKVDGKTIKADTWYKLQGGKFVEVTENDK